MKTKVQNFTTITGIGVIFIQLNKTRRNAQREKEKILAIFRYSRPQKVHLIQFNKQAVTK